MEIYRRTKTSLSEIDSGIIAACHFRIRFDIIDATISTFSSNNLFSSFEKAKKLNKVINNKIGLDITSSYKRASNITDKIEKFENTIHKQILTKITS